MLRAPQRPIPFLKTPGSALGVSFCGDGPLADRRGGCPPIDPTPDKLSLANRPMLMARAG
jgi:hypothetical protein